MSFKHLITSTCMALVLSGTVCFPVNARHVTNDPAANVLDAGILVQDLMAVVLKISDLAEFVKRNISFGDLGAIFSGFDYTKNIKELSKQLPKPKLEGVDAELSKQFETAAANASQMKTFVDKVLPSSSEDKVLTDKEKADQKEVREAIRNEAISDAYAVSVAYKNKKTAAAEEVVKPVQNNAAGAETQQAKQAAANEVGLARLNELIESNVLAATLLKLQAAEAMANLPVDL